jgi:16S rRNA (cytosine1402-N4)-methyltransferase
MNTVRHEPVLLAEVVEAIQPRGGGVYLDATAGLGGHAEAILDRSAPSGRLVGLDRDPDAVAFARERLSSYGDRVTLVHAAFDSLDDVLRAQDIAVVDGALMDLGMSSYQLDASARGFSFRSDEPLDMRMDPTGGETAADILRYRDAVTLEYLFRVYGEERYSRRVADAIVATRRREPLRTTGELARLVERLVPVSGRHIRHRIHPATRVFQALRIAVNDELGQLERALPKALSALDIGATFAVISFHSLEDRIVKRAFRTAAKDGGDYELVAKKPFVASDDERHQNPRSRSAKLRVIRRVNRSKSS